MEKLTLNNGIEMPMLGMGTYPLNGIGLALLVRKAVSMGYRSFDLASAYGNELWFGRGMRFCGKARSELFVSTKLSNTEQRNGGIQTALQKSLARLGTKYVDLYLMHWPVPDLYVFSWKQMEVLYRKGLARAIGVCNFHEHHLETLLNTAEVVPAVNQIELHPLLSQCGLVEVCNRRGIQVQAYSPFAQMHDRLIKHEVLLSIARRHQRTVPQVILRWDLQNGTASVPRSSNPARLRENISIDDFTLSDEEMNAIGLLNADLRVRYNPDNCDFSKL
jgi:diketogulonate reductase-like aldo/keto reductase